MKNTPKMPEGMEPQMVQRGSQVMQGSQILGSFDTPSKAQQYMKDNLTKTKEKSLSDIRKGLGLPYSEYGERSGVLVSPASKLISSTRGRREDKQMVRQTAQSLADQISTMFDSIQ